MNQMYILTKVYTNLCHNTDSLFLSFVDQSSCLKILFSKITNICSTFASNTNVSVASRRVENILYIFSYIKYMLKTIRYKYV